MDTHLQHAGDLIGEQHAADGTTKKRWIAFSAGIVARMLRMLYILEGCPVFRAELEKSSIQRSATAHALLMLRRYKLI